MGRFKLIICLLVGTIYTSAYAQVEQDFTVMGQIDTVNQAIYYITYIKGDTILEDTIQLDAQKKFVLQGRAEEPVFIYLSVKNTYDSTLVGDITCYQFWAEPGKIIYFEGKKGFGNQVVRNSDTNEAAEILQERRAPITNQLRLIRLRSTEGIEFDDSKLRDSLRQEYDNVTVEFIKENSYSFYAAVQIMEMVKFSSEFNHTGKVLFDGLAENIKLTKLGKSIESMLDVKFRLQVGEIFPDFMLNDTQGKAVKLSRFRGKYLLVDFWASWCAPCRKENPNIVKAYQQYHPKGLEILSVSLDEDKENWLKAIEDDGLRWTNVSDLKAFESAVVKELYIRSVPDNFLLDQDGRIIARKIRNGELNEKLAELF